MENLSNIVYESLRKLNKHNNINMSDYDFLNTEPNLKHPIIIGLGDSHAYGTDIETSDMDIRGVALHSKDDILLGRGFEQVVNEKTDTTIYSLKKIVQLLINCNPNTIEIVGLKPEHYLYLSDIGKEFIKNRDMFLSMKCVGSFMGYANQQMYRLQQKTLSSLSKEELNNHICKTLNGMKTMLEEQLHITDVVTKLVNGEIVVDLSVKDYPAEDLAKVLGALNNTLREYRKESTRNNKAIEHGKVAKHAMHLLRLYMMCEDILLYGEINSLRKYK